MFILSSRSQGAWDIQEAKPGNHSSIQSVLEYVNKVDQSIVTHPPLDAVIFTLRSYLTPVCLWEETHDIVTLLTHLEFCRRDLALQAAEHLKRERHLRPSIRKSLTKLSDEQLSQQRRQSYWTMVLSLWMAHIRYCTCGPQETLVPSLLKKYFPKDLSKSKIFSHNDLLEDEMQIWRSTRSVIMASLKNVEEWEDREGWRWQSQTALQGNDTDKMKRELYLKEFGDPFYPNEGANLGQAIWKFIDKVENNANALRQLEELMSSKESM